MPEQPNNIAESSSSGTSASTTTVRDAASSASPGSATSPGLSKGMLVGVVVVASLCALGLGVLAVYLLWRWIKRRGTKKNNHYVGMPPAQYPGFQLQRGYTQSGGRSNSTTKNSTSKGHTVTIHARVPQELPAEPAAGSKARRGLAALLSFYVKQGIDGGDRARRRRARGQDVTLRVMCMTKRSYLEKADGVRRGKAFMGENVTYFTVPADATPLPSKSMPRPPRARPPVIGSNG
ncbi:hypothetical protein Hte_001386 [Hypoxylon texense]